MAVEIKMPQLGLTMTEGTVGAWLKQVGDAVSKGEPILEITTDKLTSEIESEADGILIAIVAKEGDDVAVQGTLGYIGEKGEEISVEQPAVSAVVQQEEAVPAKVETAFEKPQSGGRIKISPLAKKTAQKLSVDYTGICGTGPGGRILQRDVLAAQNEQPKAAPMVEAVSQPAAEKPKASGSIALMEGDTVVKLAGMRKVVAERMSQSRREIPSVTQNVKIDVTALMKFRKELNAGRNTKFSVNDFILKAVAKALRQNPHILVSLDGDQIIKRAHVNLGMAVALDDGLIVPVIQDADKLGLEALSAKAKELAEKARDGRLQMDEYKGSTFSISNLGMFGVETFDPIVNQPDAAILGVCAIHPELALDADGKVYEKQMMRISLTFDHRLIDGATAAKFELEIKKLLEDPMSIIL